MTGRSVADRTARVTSPDTSGSQPKTWPPLCTLGQEMLTSRAWIPGTPLSAAATLPYSSTVSPKMFTITFVSNWRSQGSLSAMKALTPTF